MKLTSLADTSVSTVSHNSQIAKKPLITNGQIPHLTQFAQAVFPPGAVAWAHQHTDMTEVFFIQSGQGQMRVNGTRIDLPAGSCITIEPGDEHELSNTGRDELVVLYFGVA